MFEDFIKCIYRIIYDFQPLIAGVLALCAALITVRVLTKQINLTTTLTSAERRYQFLLSNHKDKKDFCVVTEAMLSEMSAFRAMIKSENLIIRLKNLILEVENDSPNQGHIFFFFPIPERPYTLAYTTHIGKVPGTGYMQTHKVALYYTALMNGLHNINAINHVINDSKMSNEAKVKFIKNTIDKILEISNLAESAGHKLITQREQTMEAIENFAVGLGNKF